MHEAIKPSSSSEAGPATRFIVEAFMQLYFVILSNEEEPAVIYNNNNNNALFVWRSKQSIKFKLTWEYVAK